MPTDDDTGEDTDGEGENETQGMHDLRQALKRAKAERDSYKSAAERTPTLERELAFAKAGIAADSPISPYFTKGYEGELTPEAIRAAALAAGVPLLGVSAEATGNGQTTERRAEVDTHRQMDTTTGGNQGGGTDSDAYFKALDEAGHDRNKIMDVVEKFGMATTRNRQD